MKESVTKASGFAFKQVWKVTVAVATILAATENLRKIVTGDK